MGLGMGRAMGAMGTFQAAKADYEAAWKEEDPVQRDLMLNTAHAKHAEAAYNLAKMYGGIYCKAAQFVASLQVTRRGVCVAADVLRGTRAARATRASRRSTWRRWRCSQTRQRQHVYTYA